MRKPSVPELLAPAGSEESLLAALAAGADAVYFGAQSFSNRMRARNFTKDGLLAAIAKAHDCGAKAYITLNTRIRDREAKEALSLCETVLGGKETCDAIICADLGLASLIRKHYPHAILHGSTQTSCSSVADCRALSALGFTRLVLPRELSLEEIKALCRNTDTEIEIFLHGAHCVSLSGQCLMSYFIGGRSGNRGECAQPCRLPYQIGSGKASYPLSLADMCLAGHITDLLASGVCSLKIEGRLKPPSYVYGVTKIYRTLLDEGRNGTKAEIGALSDLFTRGFTDGYFTHRYVSMGGTKGSEKSARLPDEVIRAALSERLRRRQEEVRAAAALAKRPITAVFQMRANCPMSLTLSCGPFSAAVYGDIPTPASGKGTDRETAAKNLSKFGATPFVLSDGGLRCTMDEGLFCPLSALNDLRRRATEALLSAMEEANADRAGSTDSSEKMLPSAPPADGERASIKIPAKAAVTGEFLDPSPIFRASEEERQALFGAFDRLYVPWERAEEISALQKTDACAICGVLPVLEPSSDRLDKLLSRLKDGGITRILAHTPGQCAQAVKMGLTADISFRGNITNEAAALVYAGLGCETIFASPELPAGAVSALHLGATVYGKLPAMTLSRCVICLSESGQGRCKKGNEGGRHHDPFAAKPHECRCTITDRTGAVFSVFGQQNCENLIVNAHPIWMGDRMDSLRGASAHHYFFSDETVSQALDILRRYTMGEKGEGRRL